MTAEEIDRACMETCHPGNPCPHCEYCGTAHCSLNASAHIACVWFGDGTDKEKASRKAALYKQFGL